MSDELISVMKKMILEAGSSQLAESIVKLNDLAGGLSGKKSWKDAVKDDGATFKAVAKAGAVLTKDSAKFSHVLSGLKRLSKDWVGRVGRTKHS